MSILILPFLLGAVLGMRFNVLVLFPAIAGAVLIALAAGLARDASVWAMCIDPVVAAGCLQVGYVSAILIRYSLAPVETAAVPGISRSA